jgi:signal transduction histidine kinase
MLYPGTPQYQKVLALVIGSIFTLLALFRVFDLASVNNRPRTYLAVYFIVIFVGIAFISDPSTPYALGAFMIVFLLNLYYGSQGAIYGIAFFAFTSIVKFFYFEFTTGLTFTDSLNIAATLAVFIAVGSIFINLQKVFDWDHARLGTTTKQAILESKRLNALINNMTESVLVLDKSYKVRLYNAAALALFNTNSSLENKSLGEFAAFQDDKHNSLTIDMLMPTGPKPVTRNDILLCYSQEDVAALSMTITPLQSSFGREAEDETGFIITMRDITREKSLEDERNEFISVISHELRTPVTVTEASISNAMIINERGGNDEKIGHSLSMAHDQAVFLANMLNDLSTFARAEKGTLELELTSFSPGDLVKLLENDYRKETDAKQMQIKSEVADGVPAEITSNKLYVREILQNFITNAIKYSDQGTVTISVSPTDDGVRFDISDQGIGISTSDQKKVFDKFFRSEDFHTRSRNGTGLGLYVVKKLAKLLQATFELSSELGKGSTFSVLVPDLKQKASAAAETTEPVPTPAQTTA